MPPLDISLRYRPDTTQGDAEEKLAEILYLKMEHLDPSDNCPSWYGLSEFDREFYRICIRQLLSNGHLLSVALGYKGLPTTAR